MYVYPARGGSLVASGGHRLDGEPVGLDHPLDLLGVREVEVGQLHAPTVPLDRRYRHRRPMYRFLFSPRWIGFHLLVLAGIVLMVNLGFWQLRRLDERQAFNAQVTSRIDLPPAPLDAVLGPAPIPTTSSGAPSRPSGRYLPDEEVRVVNRSQGGLAGDIVVTPLAARRRPDPARRPGLRAARHRRGAAPAGDRRRRRPAASVSQERRRGQLSDAGDGRPHRGPAPRHRPPGRRSCRGRRSRCTSSWRRRDPAEAGPYPQPVDVPELSEGPHLSYAVQWFIFSAAVAVGWVLAVRKSITARRAGSPPADGAAAPEPAAAAPPSSG